MDAWDTSTTFISLKLEDKDKGSPPPQPPREKIASKQPAESGSLHR